MNDDTRQEMLAARVNQLAKQLRLQGASMADDASLRRYIIIASSALTKRLTDDEVTWILTRIKQKESTE